MAAAVLKSPARRAALRGAAMAGLALGLTGCGFALRQAPKFAFESVQVTGLENTSMSRALQQAMLASGIRVVNSSSVAQTAAQTGAPVAPQVVLHVITDQHERVVSGQNESGEVRELTLKARFRFRLATPAGKYLLEETELLLERDISFSETAALAKAAEETMMFRDMDGDIVQQVVRRLAAVKSL
ncbi:LPS-assembly lipoprotein LptE [Hydrogenophaga sp. MI9]|uniref:LPS-assembly lipoprotein LptE n=1 Tax=Hydrogenophaga sp. MI9 TaxID=3453719 RepID=UPI003EEF823F